MHDYTVQYQLVLHSIVTYCMVLYNIVLYSVLYSKGLNCRCTQKLRRNYVTITQKKLRKNYACVCNLRNLKLRTPPGPFADENSSIAIKLHTYKCYQASIAWVLYIIASYDNLKLTMVYFICQELRCSSDDSLAPARLRCQWRVAASLARIHWHWQLEVGQSQSVMVSRKDPAHVHSAGDGKVPGL